MTCKIAWLLPALFCSWSKATSLNGRIKNLFDTHPVFDEDLLISVFKEKPEEEFLLGETKSLITELTSEFSDWIESEQIGEPTHQGRKMDLISFKHRPEYTKERESSGLFDGAHHSRELVTIKMTFGILLKLLHGVHY